jgi:hypothetical protein
MDPDVIQDPVFQELLLKSEIAGHKLRDAVIALRSYYLTHHKSPQEDDLSDQWKSSMLCETASGAFEKAQDAYADLLRYAYEIVPRDGSKEHMELLRKLKEAHRERLEMRAGWGKTAAHPRGIEEKVLVDGGPPVTVVIHPKHYEFTTKAKMAKLAKERREAAMRPPDDDSTTVD